jgi:hypothetical protein
VEIPKEIVPLVEGGVASWLATCGTAGIPEAARVRGTRVHAGRATLTLLVPHEQSGTTFANLDANRRIAVFYCRVTDYAAVQIKGDVLGLRPSDDRDRETQALHMDAFIEACAGLGVPRELMRRHAYWPSLALDVLVRQLYVQTPGPEAGRSWPTPR